MEPRATRIEFVDRLPLPGRCVLRRIADGHKLHEPRTDRPRPPQAAACDGLQLDVIDTLAIRQRDVKHNRLEGRQLLASRQGRAGSSERHEHDRLRGDIGWPPGWPQPHPQFDGIVSPQRHGEERLDPQTEQVTGPAHETDGRGREAAVGGRGRGHTQRVARCRLDGEAVAETVENLLGRCGEKLGDRNIDRRGRLRRVGGREPNHDPRLPPVGHGEFDPVVRHGTRLTHHEGFAVLVHHDRSIRLDRERPPREGNPRRGPADDLNIARPRLRRAATPQDADAHCPRLRRQRDGALGQHAEHSKRDESADRYHHKTLKAGERGSMRGGDDSDRSAGGQSRFGQEKQSKTSSVR